jgi:hypothetical protein
MEARYDCPANTTGIQQQDHAWLFHPTRTRGKLPKLQSSWEGPYIVITQIDDVVYGIQRHPRMKMLAVHLDRLAPYPGDTGNSFIVLRNNVK